MLSDIMLNKVTTDFSVHSFYLGFSTDTSLEAFPGATSLDGEYGSRVSCSVTIIDNLITISGVRSTAFVVDTATGDTLTGIGLFDSVTGGEIFAVTTLPSILHTTAFDFDVDEAFTFSRGSWDDYC